MSKGVFDHLTHSQRKERPICTGVIDYFPDALAEVAYCSFSANRQHNPGEKMHWAKHKSVGEGDEIVRHLIDRGKMDRDGIRHSAKLAWRALEILQREIEAEKALVSTVNCTEAKAKPYAGTPLPEQPGYNRRRGPFI